ncbi:MAG: chemotaxis protein CheX [Armatimonadota bacterium]
MSSLDQTLSRVAERAFEGLAFMFSMSEDEADAAGSPSAAARVAFAGPLRGELVVSVSESMLPDLAANMLGLDDAVSPTSEEQQDALKELANVVCGHLLPEIAGAEAVFDVRAPGILSSERLAQRCLQRKPSATARLWLDAGRATVMLFVDQSTSGAQGR